MARHYSHGDIKSVGDARIAGYLVEVQCGKCRARSRFHPYTLICKRNSLVGAPLNTPLPGFYCRTCRMGVQATIVCTFAHSGTL